MKVKKITIEYTTGKKEEIKPGKEVGFLAVGDSIRPTAKWSIDDVFKTIASLLLSTMSESVEEFGTYRPLFDKLEETIGLVEKQLSPAQFSKDFANKFAQAALYQEVFESKNHENLKSKVEKLMKKAADTMKYN